MASLPRPPPHSSGFDPSKAAPSDGGFVCPSEVDRRSLCPGSQGLPRLRTPVLALFWATIAGGAGPAGWAEVPGLNWAATSHEVPWFCLQNVVEALDLR